MNKFNILMPIGSAAKMGSAEQVRNPSTTMLTNKNKNVEGSGANRPGEKPPKIHEPKNET